MFHLALLAVLLAASSLEHGIASVYTTNENGTETACGPPLNDNALTAAHKTLPCGSKVKVTNLSNGKSVMVTVTDRGPYVKNRIVDLTQAAARAIGISGLGMVTVEVVN